MSNPVITITMKNGDVMKGELYPEIAPNTVNNFISLANKHFYDGKIFHRVIPGFMIQGGCPEGTGMGGPGYSIKGEFAQNGFANDLKHTPGVLSMARAHAIRILREVSSSSCMRPPLIWMVLMQPSVRSQKVLMSLTKSPKCQLISVTDHWKIR